MFFVFGKCPFLLCWKFLLRWKNVLSGSHALHFRFLRNKSVTRTVLFVNRPFIIRYTSGYRALFPLHVRCSYSHCLTSRLHIPIARTLSGRGDIFLSPDNQILHILVRFPSGTYPFAGVTKPLVLEKVNRDEMSLL